MDGAPRTNRKYPSYTTTELEAFVAAGESAAFDMDVMVQEIADRKAGQSRPRATPQLRGGKIQTKIGRM